MPNKITFITENNQTKATFDYENLPDVQTDAIKKVLGITPSAAQVSYDNTTSGLEATDVQEAIDELAQSGGEIHLYEHSISINNGSRLLAVAFNLITNSETPITQESELRNYLLNANQPCTGITWDSAIANCYIVQRITFNGTNYLAFVQMRLLPSVGESTNNISFSKTSVASVVDVVRQII